MSKDPNDESTRTEADDYKEDAGSVYEDAVDDSIFGVMGGEDEDA